MSAIRDLEQHEQYDQKYSVNQSIALLFKVFVYCLLKKKIENMIQYTVDRIANQQQHIQIAHRKIKLKLSFYAPFG